VSTASRKGYDGERPIELLLQGMGLHVARPRAGRPQDHGDFTGLPLVISAKNHATARLGPWTSELEAMAVHAGVRSGVVWHKRKGKASPLDWYVTTTGRLFLPLLALACEQWDEEVT
jgi:hypothetical protein